MSKRRYTKRPLVLTSVRLPEHDRHFLYLAALQLGLSQSEALRQAVRKFSADVLLHGKPPSREAEGAR